MKQKKTARNAGQKPLAEDPARIAAMFVEAFVAEQAELAALPARFSLERGEYFDPVPLEEPEL